MICLFGGGGRKGYAHSQWLEKFDEQIKVVYYYDHYYLGKVEICGGYSQPLAPP